MIGVGFGGCVIVFVKEENIFVFKNNVYDEYMKVVGYVLEFYVVYIGNGIIKIDLEVVYV